MLVLAACVPAPKKDYTPADIDQIEALDELMRVHAKHADPLFAIRDEEQFDEAELAKMREAGAILQAAAAQLESVFAPRFEAGFADHARRLGDQAGALSAAAEAADAVAARDALARIRETCSGCHRDHR